MVHHFVRRTTVARSAPIFRAKSLTQFATVIWHTKCDAHHDDASFAPLRHSVFQLCSQ